MGENIFKPASSYSKEDLIKCSEGKLFSPTDGKLPNNEMLMMDRITEVDLKKEAGNTIQTAKFFENSNLLYVPKVYLDYSGSRTLTLEKIEGIPVTDLKILEEK